MEAESAAHGSLRPPHEHLKEMMVNENGAQERDQGWIGLGGVICIKMVFTSKDYRQEQGISSM